MAHVPLAAGLAQAGPAGPGTGGKDEIDLLHDLHTRLIDTLDGYDKVLEKAEPQVLGVVEEFRGLHGGQAEKVRAMLLELGAGGGSDGSFRGAVNRAVVELRSWFTEIDRNILDVIVDAEKRLLGAFEDVFEASPSVERRARIDQMRGETLLLLTRHAPDRP